MLFNAVKQYHYTAELYEITENTDGQPVSQTYLRTQRLSLDTNDQSSLNIDSLEPLRVGTVLRNIKDRNDELIYPSIAGSGDLNSGEAYVVFFEQPVLSPFGTREGFTSKARRLKTA